MGSITLLNKAFCLLDAIEESKKHISNVVTTGLETAAEHLRNRLESSQNLLDTEKSRIVGEIESLARPVGFEVLEWESANRERHGQTTVENRMKRLEKVLKAEEASLSRHAQQLVDIDNSILDLAKEIFGPETSESSLLGEKEPEAWNGIGMQELRTAFDGQKNRYCEMIDEAIGSSLESMRESEQVWASFSCGSFTKALLTVRRKTLTLRQVKAQESFYAIFRDDA